MSKQHELIKKWLGVSEPVSEVELAKLAEARSLAMSVNLAKAVGIANARKLINEQTH